MRRTLSMQWRRWFGVVAASALLAGCQTAYYATMEKFGVHKRDILVERVSDARDAQEEAKEQFRSALERFSAVLGFQGGDLKEKYEQLNEEFERSEARAEEVRERIAAVEEVSEALFEEWEEELEQYSNASLRLSSQRQLTQTKRQYAQLIKAMRRAEAKITPVLDAFRDQVLFLKHNLNARAIASLKGELAGVESNVASLIRDMERSIREANRFIDAMNRSNG
ncbi:MAG: DUF2959 domain-containing protein [Gammaproteobacteria bacterium]